MTLYIYTLICTENMFRMFICECNSAYVNFTPFTCSFFSFLQFFLLNFIIFCSLFPHIVLFLLFVDLFILPFLRPFFLPFYIVCSFKGKYLFVFFMLSLGDYLLRKYLHYRWMDFVCLLLCKCNLHTHKCI